MSQSFAFALFLATVATLGILAGDDTPPFKITTKRDADNVELKVEKDKTVFSVQSPKGIGQAVIERTNEKWPDAVVLQLHLKGLESFRASNSTVTLHGAVSSQSGNARIWKNGEEDKPLDAKSPYWMEIRIIGGDGKPAKTIPLKDGYFEIQLPKVFFEGNPKSITVNWIDFYRD